MVLHAVIIGHDTAAGTTFLEHAAGRLSVPLLAGMPGTPARVRVRARDVALAIGEPGRLSIRNRLPATVMEMRDGNDGAVDVRLDAGGEPLLARITHAAARDLDLKTAMPVTALIKAAAFGRPDDPA